MASGEDRTDWGGAVHPIVACEPITTATAIAAPPRSFLVLLPVLLLRLLLLLLVLLQPLLEQDRSSDWKARYHGAGEQDMIEGYDADDEPCAQSDFDGLPDISLDAYIE